MDQIKTPFIIPYSAVLLTFLTFVGITFGIALDFNLALPVVFFSGIGLFILFRERPLIFFGILLVARMSLDYSSQYLSFTFYDITLSLSQLLGIGIALLGAYCLYLYYPKVKTFGLNTPFLILLIWGVLTLTISLSPSLGISEIIRIFDLYVIALLSYLFIKSKDDLQFLLKAILLSSFIPSLVALYQYVNHIGFSDADVSIPRIYGTFAHPNTLSLYLFSLLVVSFIYYLLNRKNFTLHQEKIFYGLSLFFAFLLFLTFARVAWVITFFFLFLIAVARMKKLLLPLVLIPLILVLLSPTFQGRIMESLSPAPDSSIVWRQNLWSDVIQKTIQDDRILIGSGINTFPLFTTNLRGSLPGSNDAHNDFVKFFVEGGFIGLGILLCFYILLFEILIKAKHTLAHDSALSGIAFALMLFLLCLTIASLTDNIFKNTPVQWIFFALFGAVLALARKVAPQIHKHTH
jgi:putative inorganic carbon (hco3(-)) transporter